MMILLTLTFCVVVGTLTYGIIQKGKDEISGKEKMRKALKVNLSIFVPVVTAALVMNIPSIAHAAEATSAGASGLGYLAAGLSTGLATIGAGYAVGSVGSAALGAVSEDPKILGKTLIYVGLGEGIAIYGLIISIMILSRL
ncbi:ATP synthase subunit C [Clostridium algidicarnis]|uniref:ATP synthase F(0) sector subunit c n=2 Tax=Clostridium algidicarnis TaxID=37659 RepID=A0A2S6FY48_9CLOT|nr:ATP synthase subunit C [Clostridium algidicarnis]MBB6630145.1 ATPase [Clostridium algidicarnis]MBU3194663.1 ATP synthase subunit C [Clostridium algidicarnis]MBU3206313.1 ATP synthase subunit C [Clostridium algidicarnis]MBU3220959.1 ATP synthase subunit C [Clostridium algidicarnis]MCB2285750.1 ATP synthase subunit C [Clostridium algidicarnis]